MAQGKYVRRRQRQPRFNPMILILAALLIFLGILLLAGWLFQVYRNAKQQRCGSVRRGVE